MNINLERCFPGVKNAEVTTYHFESKDGFKLALTRFCRKPAKIIILLVHSFTASSDMFSLPEHYNLVSYLLDNDYTEVWSFEWRGSNYLPYLDTKQNWNIDDIALYDVPACIDEIRKHIGNKPLHIIAHCVGSLAFAMGLAAANIKNITSFVSSSIFLVAKAPLLTKIKLFFMLDFFLHVLRVSNVQTNTKNIKLFSKEKLISLTASLLRRNCKNKDCHILSYCWGSGDPTLFLHENLLEETHNKLASLFGTAPTSSFPHLRKMMMFGFAVKSCKKQQYNALPENYLLASENIDTPILFLTGDKNQTWANSNILCYEVFRDKFNKKYNSLAVIKNYGHADIFLGKNAHQDVFPRILAFINSHAKETIDELFLTTQ